MSTTELLIPITSSTPDEWSIARVTVNKDVELPLLKRLSAWGPAHYPAGQGRAIITLASSVRDGLFEVLERDGRIEVVAHDEYDASWRLPPEPVPLAGGVDVVASHGGASPSARRIVLHPGLAFGDCRHPTTRLCASAIAERACQRPLGSLLDVGSGSGILALVGHRLGASSIVATDNDPYSRFVTRENARRNGLDLEVMYPIPEGRRFDVVVANVWASAFPDLAPALIGALADDGLLVLSGFPETEADAVRELFGDRPCTTMKESGWAALLLTHFP